MSNHKQPIDSLSGVVTKKRKTRPGKGYYLGIEPLPQNKKSNKSFIKLEFDLTPLKFPNLPYRKINKKWLRRIVYIIASITVVFLFGLVFSHIYKAAKKNNPPDTSLPSTPIYDPIKPTDKANEDSTTPQSYDPTKKVISFQDSIAGVDVTVSEQPLPDSFKSQPDIEVEKLAKSLNADKVIYAREVRAYTNFLSEDGTQTVLFTKKGLLIFIHGAKEIDHDGLVQYIVKLE